jgi:hypothetical protein
MTNSFYLSDLIGIAVSSVYTQAAKEGEVQELSDSTEKPEKFLAPVTVFNSGTLAHYIGGKKEACVSLGIFNLLTPSAVATISKDNKLEVTWRELKRGNGKFTTTIPSYLVVTGSPRLTYEGGVLDITIPVNFKSEDGVAFVGKLTRPIKEEKVD